MSDAGGAWTLRCFHVVNVELWSGNRHVIRFLLEILTVHVLNALITIASGQCFMYFLCGNKYTLCSLIVLVIKNKQLMLFTRGCHLIWRGLTHLNHYVTSMFWSRSFVKYPVEASFSSIRFPKLYTPKSLWMGSKPDEKFLSLQCKDNSHFGRFQKNYLPPNHIDQVEWLVHPQLSVCLCLLM